MVDQSADVNVAQLVGTQDGETRVATYQWASLFKPYFTKLIGIKKYQHFRFDASRPGVVFVKVYSDSSENAVRLLTDAS